MLRSLQSFAERALSAIGAKGDRADGPKASEPSSAEASRSASLPFAVMPAIRDIALFGGVFVVCLAVLAGVALSGIQWWALEKGFSQDSRYQLHSFLLGELPREVPLLLLGDSRFQVAVSEDMISQPHERVTINHYDSDDLADAIRSLRSDGVRLDVKVCTVVAQVSPFFMVRAKQLGAKQNITLARSYSRLSVEKPFAAVEHLFSTIDLWMQTKTSDLEADGRLSMLVGQGRRADPTQENWKRVLDEAAKFKGKIIFVSDARGTDLGPGSELPARLQSTLEAAAAEHPERISFSSIDTLDEVTLPGCE